VISGRDSSQQNVRLSESVEFEEARLPHAPARARRQWQVQEAMSEFCGAYLPTATAYCFLINRPAFPASVF